MTSVEECCISSEFLCSPCLDDGSGTEAAIQCVNCQANFCQSCLELHNRILKSHTLIRRSEIQNKIRQEDKKGKTMVLHSVKCDDHPEEILKMFCGKHDLVCCTVCIALNHRMCDGIDYIPNIAKGISQSQEKFEVLKSLVDTREDLRLLLSRRQRDLSELRKQKSDIFKKIKDMTGRLIARIDQIEKDTSEQVEKEYRRTEDDIKNDITSLETTLESLHKCSNKIKEIECQSKSETFLQIKLGQKEINRGRKQSVEMIKKKVEYLEFEMDQSIESYLNEVESYCSVTGKSRKLEVSLLGKYDIKMESETKDGINVYGVCLLDNNEVILTDNSNLKLKRLDTEYRVLDWLDLGATPYGVCRTGHSEVAISFPWLHKIQFVSIGRKMVLKWSFKVDEICRGICYCDGNLYICCGGSGSEDPGHVMVSDMAGCPLRTFQTSQTGEFLFRSPQNICISDKESKVFIADKGLVVLNKEGDLLSVISDLRVDLANDVCVGDSGQIFLCCSRSNNVLQFDKHGTNVQEILNESDNIVRPLTVTFLRHPARLLITSEGSGVIRVFKLKYL